MSEMKLTYLIVVTENINEVQTPITRSPQAIELTSEKRHTTTDIGTYSPPVKALDKSGCIFSSSVPPIGVNIICSALMVPS
jgi:hypothetical protein